MLNGKTAVVTGAAKGIGKAVALAFAKKGCNIVLNYHSTLPDGVVSEIEACGVKCLPVKGDVADFGFAAQLVKDVKKEFGTLDVLVNNAGITRDMLLMRMSEEQFDQGSGAIINMASVSGVTGNIGQANYAASKAGVIGLTKSAARELAQRGVTCNAIAPGFIETDMTDVLAEDIKKGMLESIPLKRYGKVEDIASAAVFLAENTYITGQVLNVDGGMVM